MDLFDHRVPLDWLPDETLFSWGSRFHTMSGNHLASTTCMQLFGDRQKGSAHDFPSRIEAFVSRTHGLLGDVVSIVSERSLLPFYLPLLSPKEQEWARSALCGPSIGSLKYRLGLAASRLGANHPLKACFECMEADRTAHGTPYWRRTHQWPGVLTCFEHHAWLAYATVKANGVGRFQWFLPNEANLHMPMRTESIPPDVVVLLAKSAIQFAHLTPGTCFTANNLSGAYRIGLNNRGLLIGSARNRLSVVQIGPLYCEFLAQLRIFNEFVGLPATPGGASDEVRKLVSASCCRMHPLRHLALITWLFGSFDQSHLGCTCTAQPADEPAQHVPDVMVVGHLEGQKFTEFIALVKTGTAITSAARAVGIDPATGMAWAAKANIETVKRPSAIRGKVKTAMIRALMAGASKERVATIGNVSVQSVTRLLRTEVGLQVAWHGAMEAKRQKSARKMWQKVVIRNPLAGAAAARTLEPATYAWLYRNDRDWLKEQINRLERVKHTGVVRVDWDKRDCALAMDVRLAGLELSNQLNGKRPKLWQLYQLLPELRSRLAKLDRFPLTQQAIEEVACGRWRNRRQS
jgi:hypothetical protein